jgi:Flp pilus assembly protein TadG
MQLQSLFQTQSPPITAPSPAPRFADEQGSALIEFAFMLPMLVLLLTGAVDLGRAWYFDIEVASAAEAGALYGVQNPGDISGMNAAASLDAPDLANLQTSSTYGSECSDGSSVVALSTSTPTCSANAVEFVEVDTTATYKPMLIYPGAASLFTMTAKSRMRTMN